MTKRAIVIGFAAALLMGVGGQYVVKYVPGMNGLILGHLPVTVFGILILFAIGINPLLGKIRDSWRLKPGEIALVLAFVLMACGLAEAGLMRYFPRTLIHPVIHNHVEPGWQDMKLMEQTPSALLVNGAQYSEEVIEGYRTQMGEPGEPIAFGDVPWHGWWRPLLTWGCIIGFTLVGVISLSVLVHRQWADKERLRYPLAELATSLFKRDESGKTVIFQNRLFWLAIAIFCAVRIVSGLHVWFPGGIHIPLSFDFRMIKESAPEFWETPFAARMLRPAIHPACIGLTFLLASEIGFSLGITNLFTVLVLYMLLNVGVDVSGTNMTGGYVRWQSFGSWLALAVMLVFMGRRYYWQTLKEAVTFKAQEETQTDGVWACRVFLVCMLVVTVILSVLGLDWPIALLAVLLMMLLFVGCARMVAECGTFFFVPGWMFPGIMVGLFGLTNLSPTILIVLGLLFYVLTFDPFEALMPFIVNGLKTASDMKLDPGKVGLLLGLALVVTLAVMIPTAVWADYNNKVPLWRGGDTHEIYATAGRAQQQLSVAGELDRVRGYSSWERLARMRPSAMFLVAVGVGFVLLLGCSAMRLRFSRWPLHPVLFLGFGSWTMAKWGPSFMLGWFVRVIVNKFGGAHGYLNVRPFMIGMIVGDLLGAFVLIFAGWVYYMVMGTAGMSALPW